MTYGFLPRNWPAFQRQLAERGLAMDDIEKVELRPTTPSGTMMDVVVMRMARPARTRMPDDRLPETRHALGETVEGRAEADVVDEGQRARRASHAQAGRAAEAAVALRLEIAAWRRHGARIAAWHAGSVTSWSAPTDRCTPGSRPRWSAGCAGTTTGRRRSIRGRAVRCGWCGRNRGPIAPRPRVASGT